MCAPHPAPFTSMSDVRGADVVPFFYCLSAYAETLADLLLARKNTSAPARAKATTMKKPFPMPIASLTAPMLTLEMTPKMPAEVSRRLEAWPV